MQEQNIVNPTILVKLLIMIFLYQNSVKWFHTESMFKTVIRDILI